MLRRYEWQETVSAKELGEEARSALLDHLAKCLRAAGSTVVRREAEAISFEGGCFVDWVAGDLVTEGEVAVVNAGGFAALLCRGRLPNYPLWATLACVFLLPMAIMPVYLYGLAFLPVSGLMLLIAWLWVGLGLGCIGRFIVRRFFKRAVADWRANGRPGEGGEVGDPSSSAGG